MSKVPNGWAITSIGQITDYVQRGKSPKYADFSELPVINQKCIRWFGIQEEHLKYVDPAQWSAWSDERFLRNGDILWNSTGTGTIGRAALYRGLETAPRAVADSHVTIVRANNAVIPDFLHRFIQSPAVQSKIDDMQAGSTNQVELGKEAVLTTSVPLPPLPEQKRIVAKIDSLSGKSKRASDHLDHIPRLVEKYKQAVLAAAFRGDLTREWRTKFNLPKWEKSTLGEVVRIASGQTPKGIEHRLTDGAEIPWFKVSSMNEPDNLNGMVNSKFRLTSKDAKALGLRVFEPGSIAFPKRGGAIATNKKRRLLVPGALDLNLMVLTAERISPDYLWWWMLKLDLSSLSNGSNVPQINNGDISPLELDIPSPDEQQEISRILKNAFSWIERLASEATSARKLNDFLDQSILAKAFRGELLPQDPDDEPAARLLERIAAERAATPKAKRGRTRKA